MKSPVRDNRPPGSVRGAPGDRRPYRDSKTLKKADLVIEVRGPDSGSASGHRFVDRRAEHAAAEVAARQANLKLPKARQAICSDPWGASTAAVDFADAERVPEAAETPETVRQAMVMARRWEQKCLLVQVLIGLKIGFYNSGFALKPVDKKLSEAGKGEFQKWEMQYRRKFLALTKHAWMDRIVTDAVVAFWRSKYGKVIDRVWLLHPERCKYSDAMAVEKLEVRLDWKREDLVRGEGPSAWGKEQGLGTKDQGQRTRRAPGVLTQAEVRRYSKGGYIELDPDLGEFFSVLRRAREGWGFGLPRMYSLFRTMEQEESMQIGDNLWGRK